MQESGKEISREFKANIYFAENSIKLHSWQGKIEFTMFEGENSVVKTGRK